MTTTSLDRYGRTTVPAAIRAHLSAKPGTKLEWTVTSLGTLLVRVVPEAGPDPGAAGPKAPEGGDWGTFFDDKRLAPRRDEPAQTRSPLGG